MTDESANGQSQVLPHRQRTGRGLIEVTVVIHRWLGLIAMAWLIVLGLTGVLIDHPDWRWVRQTTVHGSFASPKAVRDSHGAVIRKFQINPANGDYIIGGSARGLWRTTDRGVTWRSVPFAGTDTPMVYGIVPVSSNDWTRLMLATDDGLWVVHGGEGGATRFGLDGFLITALARVPGSDLIVGVHDRSRIFKMIKDSPESISWIEPTAKLIAGLPDRVGLTRLAFDLHFAQGLATDHASLLVSDLAGIALAVLSLTGLFFWLLPRIPRAGRSGERGRAMRWLYRFHGPTVGVLAAIPIIFLSLTGIFVGHATALGPWAESVTFDRHAVPGGAHTLSTLRGQIDSVAARSTDAAHLAVMTRMGLIESRDNGTTWSYDRLNPIRAEMENMNPGHVVRQGLETVGKRGTITFALLAGDAEWSRIEGLRAMVMDASPVVGGWLLKTSGGFHTWRPGAVATPLSIGSPDTGGIPLDRFFTDLHGGLMIHSQFAWLNDLFALAAILLSLTGLIGWWRRRWI